MTKKVKIHEACIWVNDNGKLSLVTSAKEAITTLSKNQVDVYIFLHDTSKENAEKFLKDNDIPYKGIITTNDKDEKAPKFDACILPEKGFIILRYDWDGALSSLTRMLYGENSPRLSPQQKMDDSFKRYLEWAKPKKTIQDTPNISS